ncbi:MAG: hypothetical protein ACHQT7_03185, partial [Candidatus Levyibacteriota bacterium]
PVTDVQLHTLVDSAEKLRSIIAYQDSVGRTVEDGRVIREKKHGAFKVTAIAAGEKRRRNARTMTVLYHDRNFTSVSLTFYESVKRGHEFNLEVGFGYLPELKKEEPLFYDSGRKKREDMNTLEYDVASDLLTRAEKIFPHTP